MNSPVQLAHQVDMFRWILLLGTAISLGTGCGGNETVITAASSGSGGSGASGTCQTDAECLNGNTCVSGICAKNQGNLGGAGTGGAETGGVGTGGIASNTTNIGTGGATPTGTGGSSNDCPAPPVGGVCNQFPACGCSVSQVCYPSESVHAMACYATDNLTEGADCTNGMCAAGLGCFGSVCKPYCNTDSDCSSAPGARKCTQTAWQDGTPITGVSVCRRVCDPVHPQNPRAPLLSCPSGFRCAAYSDTTGASGCGPAGSGTTGSACTAGSDCAAGFYCDGAGKCNAFCFTNADCNGGTCSLAFSPALFAGTYTVGYCN